MCGWEVVLPGQGPGCFSAYLQGWAPAISLVAGCSAVWSLGPWALPVTHWASDLLSVGTPVVPQALTLVCMQRGDCEDRNLFAPGEEN